MPVAGREGDGVLRHLVTKCCRGCKLCAVPCLPAMQGLQPHCCGKKSAEEMAVYTRLREASDEGLSPACLKAAAPTAVAVGRSCSWWLELRQRVHFLVVSKWGTGQLECSIFRLKTIRTGVKSTVMNNPKCSQEVRSLWELKVGINLLKLVDSKL